MQVKRDTGRFDRQQWYIAVDTAFDYVLYLFFPKTGVLGELDDEYQRSW